MQLAPLNSATFTPLSAPLSDWGGPPLEDSTGPAHSLSRSGSAGPRSAWSLYPSDMDPRLLYVLEFRQNRDFPGQNAGTAGSFSLRIGYYPIIVEAVKGDGELE